LEFEHGLIIRIILGNRVSRETNHYPEKLQVHYIGRK
jgi:hypothetical protein